MKTRFLTILLAVFLFDTTFAQTTEAEAILREKTADTTQGWFIGGVSALNIAQTSLTNWAAGGQNSLSANGLLSIYANYKKDKSVWDNSLDIGYGLLQQGENKNLIKTDDKIDLLSKYGREAYKNWYYAALFNFKTQMTEGYNYPNDSVVISNFLAPAYFVAAIGMDYKPNNYFSAFLAPLTAKTTLVNSQQLANAGAFGVEAAEYDQNGVVTKLGKKIRNEFGGYFRIIFSKNDFQKELLKNIAFTTKLDLFSNYLHNPNNIDVNWETQIALKVNKYISVNFNTHLIYDDDILISIDNNNDGILDINGPRTQFKQILGIGFSYKF